MRSGAPPHEASSGIELPTDPFDWYRMDSNGELHMIDPSTGRDLDPRNPPGLVEAEPELKGGIDFWRSNTDKVQMVNYYGSHTKADDLDAPGRFESAVASHNVFGYESYRSDKAADWKERVKVGNKVVYIS